jgi:hypothetical protein
VPDEAEASVELVLAVPDEVAVGAVQSDPTEGPKQAESAFKLSHLQPFQYYQLNLD